MRPVAAGSDFLELSLWNESTDRVSNIIFADVQTGMVINSFRSVI